MSEVSIIVPVYQTEEYLKACLESISNQTFIEFEVICVDDGSTDGSASILEECSKLDSRIRILRHSVNKGLGAARNTAIKAAQAPYLFSVDSDDQIAPDLLATLWHAAIQSDADIVSSGFLRVDSDGAHKGRIQQRDLKVSSSGVVDIFDSLLPSFCAKLWKKSLFDNNGIYFPEGIMYEDIATTPRIHYFANRIVCLQNCDYYYLERLGSITRKASNTHVYDLMAAFSVLLEFFDDRPDSSEFTFMLFEKMKKSFQNYLRGARGYLYQDNYENHLRLLKSFRAGAIALNMDECDINNEEFNI